jgi:hypothetical protein
MEQVLQAQHESLDSTDPFASAWSAALAASTFRILSACISRSPSMPRTKISHPCNHDFIKSVFSAENQNLRKVPWGGRGKGGRGTSRRTFQPDDIVLDGVTLEYVNDAQLTGSGAGGSKLLLSDAYLKLLPGKVYALVGR